MANLNGLSTSGGHLRINTRAMEKKTSSNQSFNEQIRSGIREGLGLGSSAIRQVASRIPGGAQLSASLSEAANKLSPSSSLGFSPEAGGDDLLDMGATGSQDDLVKNNKDMLDKQMKVSQITTSFSTKSYILKALFDSLKTIGANIR